MIPEFEQIFLQMAEIIAKRSYDDKTRVGCVITSEDHVEIFSLGYNGNAHGLPNKRDSLEQGKSGFIHAELNAALKCKESRNTPKNVYITHMPCKDCAKALIQLGGIRKVYFKEWYGDPDCFDIFNQVGIELIHVL